MSYYSKKQRRLAPWSTPQTPAYPYEFWHKELKLASGGVKRIRSYQYAWFGDEEVVCFGYQSSSERIALIKLHPDDTFEVAEDYAPWNLLYFLTGLNVARAAGVFRRHKYKTRFYGTYASWKVAKEDTLPVGDCPKFRNGVYINPPQDIVLRVKQDAKTEMTKRLEKLRKVGHVMFKLGHEPTIPLQYQDDPLANFAKGYWYPKTLFRESADNRVWDFENPSPEEIDLIYLLGNGPFPGDWRFKNERYDSPALRLAAFDNGLAKLRRKFYADEDGIAEVVK